MRVAYFTQTLAFIEKMLLENTKAVQLVNKFPICYETRIFNASYTNSALLVGIMKWVNQF